MVDNCCKPNQTPKEPNIRKAVRNHYGGLARAGMGGCCCQPSSNCCSPGFRLLEEYGGEKLEDIPPAALEAAAGCGNPVSLAELREGETVLDLGAGGGLDAFLAAKRVGPRGRVIGVDMTPEMVELARRNAEEAGLENVEFRLGEIEHLPVADASVDVVVSNCVINLSTDKPGVFREAYRVLRSGGRLVVSDVMAQGLPEEARGNLHLWAECVAGAIPLEEYLALIEEAGFQGVEVLNHTVYPDKYVEKLAEAAGIPGGLEGLALSHAEIRAVKP